MIPPSKNNLPQVCRKQCQFFVLPLRENERQNIINKTWDITGKLYVSGCVTILQINSYYYRKPTHRLDQIMASRYSNMTAPKLSKT